MTEFEKHTVLVAEDDPDIRAALAMLLGDWGYGVLEARDGEEALELLSSSKPPCLVLLDLRMPRMDGFQVREAMAASEQLRSIPIVVLTAHGRRAPMIARLSGVTVLGKPVDYHELLATVRTHCPGS